MQRPAAELSASIPAVSTFWEHLRDSDARNDPRAEVVALNAVLRAHGVPQGTFGPVPHVPVGTVAHSRAELCAIGMHRHFLCDVTYTTQGLESIVLGGDSEHIEDLAERIIYSGSSCPTPATPRRLTALAALATNAERQRPVRVLRVAAASSAALARRRNDCYRYDGDYMVHRLGGPDAASADDASANEERYLLLRLPGQPALPPGVGGKARKPKRAGETREAERDLSLSVTGEMVRVGATVSLPLNAEETLRIGDESMTLADALSRLHAAREAIVSRMSPSDAYAFCKRSALNQLRRRATIEQLHAADAPETRTLLYRQGGIGADGSGPRAVRPRLAPWPSRSLAREAGVGGEG